MEIKDEKWKEGYGQYKRWRYRETIPLRCAYCKAMHTDTEKGGKGKEKRQRRGESRNERSLEMQGLCFVFVFVGFYIITDFSGISLLEIYHTTMI